MLKKCPYCGRELPRPRRRLPSGFGQISEIRGKNLAKPFRAMVIVGRKENGRPICKTLTPVAYFETYKEAYKALEEYHARKGMTMDELFKAWYAEWKKTAKFPADALSVWEYCSSIRLTAVREIREADLKACVEQGYKVRDGEKIFPAPYEKSRMKHLFHMLFEYARELEIL